MSTRTFGKKAFFLPLAIALITLIGFSVFISWKLGTATRGFVARAEDVLRCRLAAASAITEVRKNIDTQFSTPSSNWEDFFRQCLPAMSLALPDPISMEAIATANALKKRVAVGSVSIECLDKSVYGGIPQGILSFTVTTESIGANSTRASLVREDKVRFVVVRHPDFGLQILLLPGVICSRSQME